VNAHASIRNGCAWRCSILKVGSVQGHSRTTISRQWSVRHVVLGTLTTCPSRGQQSLKEGGRICNLHPRKGSSLFILRAWCSPILLNVQVQRYCIVVPENRSTSGVHALPSLSSRTCRSIYPVPCLSSPGPTRPVFALSLFTLIALLCQPNNSNAPLTASAPLLVRLKASST
jgi:hypothetical protein